jgi:hypothetical protein
MPNQVDGALVHAMSGSELTADAPAITGQTILVEGGLITLGAVR